MNALGNYLKDTGETPAARAEIVKRHNLKEATIEDYLRHVDHVLKLIGPNHVGFGADWDGGDGVIGLEDISKLPKLTQWLMDRGYADQQIANIWGGNVLRVVEAAAKVAQELSTSTPVASPRGP
jgi:membrane dipeptidase